MFGHPLGVLVCLWLSTALTALSQGHNVTDASVPVVRLSGGVSERDGHVEIYFRGRWGTVCDDGWEVADAAVVCRMLGFTGLARAVLARKNLFNATSSNLTVHLRAVQCDGNEESILFCPFQLNNGVCRHDQDAGVLCLGDRLTTTLMTTTSATTLSTTTLPPRICDNASTEVRLVTSSGAIGYAAGRVQVWYNNTWRAICDNQWGMLDAQVVCRMLCFNPLNGRAVLGAQEYGNATEGYWLSGVQCIGRESDIRRCQRSQWGDDGGCDVTEPAGVSCLPDTPTPPPLPSPRVTCEGEMITASFARSVNRLLAPEYLSVAAYYAGPANNCSYVTSDDTDYVIIDVPFVGGDCNTTRELNFSHVVYSNLIRYAVPSPSVVISRTTVYYVPVHCVLPRQVDPTNRVDPALRTAPPKTGDGQFNVRLILFQDKRFQTPVSSGSVLRVVLGDWVYVGIQLFSRDSSLKLVLEQCYASPSSTPDTRPVYFLVRNRCAVEPTLTFYPINDTLMAFRFQSFRFLADYPSVYLHCRAYSCASTDNGRLCDQNCRSNSAAFSSSSRRRRRQLTSAPHPPRKYLVDSGPIVVIDSDEIVRLLATQSRGISAHTVSAQNVFVLAIFCIISSILAVFGH